jgi:hypothetical protein
MATVYKFYEENGTQRDTLGECTTPSKIYCVASFADANYLITYGFCSAALETKQDFDNEELDAKNVDLRICIDSDRDEDEKFLQKVALGRLAMCPTSVEVADFDATKLVKGPRVKAARVKAKTKHPGFATQIAEELLRVETFCRTFVQRMEYGAVKRVVCVKFRMEDNCIYYGASIWNNASGPLMESGVQETQVKLAETAACRYAQFPVKVPIPFRSKLKFDRWLFKAVRKYGTCAKIETPNVVVWK